MLISNVGRYHWALLDQPQKAILPKEYATIVPAVLFAVGQLFVVTSTWSLGITGTFLGDYFGILMDHRVEGYVERVLFAITAGVAVANPRPNITHGRSYRFPFNVLRDPMYVGSTMCFTATALWWVIFCVGERVPDTCLLFSLLTALAFQARKARRLAHHALRVHRLSNRT